MLVANVITSLNDTFNDNYFVWQLEWGIQFDVFRSVFRITNNDNNIITVVPKRLIIMYILSPLPVQNPDAADYSQRTGAQQTGRTIFKQLPIYSPGQSGVIMVKCLTQEHNMLVTAGLEPVTFGLRVHSFIHLRHTCPHVNPSPRSCVNGSRISYRL